MTEGIRMTIRWLPRILGIGFMQAFDAWKRPLTAVLFVGVPILIGSLFLLSHSVEMQAAG